MKAKFTKIKIDKDNKIHLEYFTEKENGQTDEFTLTSADKPAPSFEIALMKFRQHVLDICELPITEEEIRKITVKGVSFSYSTESNIMGAVITAQRTLRYSNCPMNINTPHKAEACYSEGGDESMLLSTKCVNDLILLQQEAHAYLEGDREQIDLFANTEIPENKQLQEA